MIVIGSDQCPKAVREAADKFLARPTSRCRRTESIVSLERGVCSCAELQVFSCYRGWKDACQATRTISTISRRELSSSSFFFLQGKVPKEIHAILPETLREYAASYATFKNWVAKFKRGEFSTCVAPRPGWTKTVTTPEIIDQIHFCKSHSVPSDIIHRRSVCVTENFRRGFIPAWSSYGRPFYSLHDKDKKRGKMFQSERATVRPETRTNSLSRFVIIKYSESASLPNSSL